MAHLWASVIINQFNSRARFQLATQGRKNLLRDKFRWELNTLVRDDVFIGRVVLNAARWLKRCSDEDLATFTAQFGIEDQQRVLEEMREVLLEGGDEHFREATVEAVCRLWTPVIQPYMMSGFDLLAPLPPPDPNSTFTPPKTQPDTTVTPASVIEEFKRLSKPLVEE
jgi:hypothetical protein